MTITTLLLVGVAALGAVLALLLARAMPRATFVGWLLVLCFVPVWVGVTVSFFWALVTLATIGAIAANLHDLRLHPADGLVIAFAALVTVLLAVRAASLSDTVIAILQWVVPYAWGRLVLARVSGAFLTRAMAAVAVVVAVIALLEFATGTNPFVLLPGGGPREVWSTLQPRAGFLRAEGAFGHSIALAASLAMLSPFVVAARWPTPVALVSVALIAGAVIVSFSRIGLVSLAIALGLSTVLLPGLSRSRRWLLGLGGVAAVLLILPFLGSVFADAGDEAGGSAAYRGDLFGLLGEAQLIGSAGDWEERAGEDINFAAFARSVDNTLLLIALRFGMVPAALVVVLFLVVALLVLRGRATPAAIAVTSQLPSLVTVALITQYGMLLWFLVGLAIAGEVQRRTWTAELELLSRPAPPQLARARGA